ncbi:site-2 protease family protein [Granulicella cerasi]|uniref:Site-2 protease family protein n=1 Tax=Granulicella cerasi TaxID=741063 RepID=A0ABW1ZE47_9BACT|nr:site-2 protease family protein [Granulicella cerasi]
MLCTLLTTTAIGMRYMDNFRHGRFPLATEADIFPFRWVLAHLADWRTGLPFSLSLLGILLAHEFGHYFACRRNGISATLPFVLPAPTLSGTAGAVIRLRQRVKTRAALLSIGAAGPIAGFCVAIITVTLGLLHSVVAIGQPERLAELNSPLLFVAVQRALTAAGKISFNGPVLWHPILVASWMGLLITSLNLIPAGILDGGHVLYALSPRIHRVASTASVVALFLLAAASWVGWIVWAIFLLTPAMRHPRVRDHSEISTPLRLLAPLCFLVLALSITPRPIAHETLFDLLRGLRH